MSGLLSRFSKRTDIYESFVFDFITTPSCFVEDNHKFVFK